MSEPLPSDTVDKSDIDPCHEPDCGRQAEDVDLFSRRVSGWTVAKVLNSGEFARAYCSPRCAARGISRMHRNAPAPADG